MRVKRHSEDEVLKIYESVFDRRRKVILNLVEQGLTRAELVRSAPIYGTHPYETEILKYFEARMIDLHLEELSLSNSV